MRRWLAIALLWINAAVADELAMPTEEDLKPNFPQPYIVQPGDTLWDIAKRFFKDPHKWIKIWERNLYITNPDLIYPGDEIWFDPKAKQTGGLRIVRVQPRVIEKPVEPIEQPVNPAFALRALKRQDFILSAKEIEDAGYVLDSPDDRVHFGTNDRIYVRLKHPAKAGDMLDIFRPSRAIEHPHTHKLVGTLVIHLGRAKLLDRAPNGIWRARIVEAFAEIERGDRLQPAFARPKQLTPQFVSGIKEGVVLYIRDDASEAGQNQIIGIDLGLDDGMRPGVMLSVHRKGREVVDPNRDEEVRLPEEKIAEIMILVPQKRASMAIITRSIAAVHIGDSVRNAAAR